MKKLGALLVVAMVVGLTAVACFPEGHCNAEESCPCVDGTTQVAGCLGAATCDEACSPHGGACPSGFTPECHCGCGFVQAVTFSSCAVLPSTCEAACSGLGGVSEGGVFDGSCPDPCAEKTFAPSQVHGLDGGVVTCFCNGSCGCFTHPDGGASCP